MSKQSQSKRRKAMIELKLQKVGDELGAVLPKQAVDRLNVAEGERLFLTETEDGYLITSQDPEVERQMRLAEDGMAAYQNTLRDLAK